MMNAIEINHNYNLLALAQSDTSLKKVAQTGGLAHAHFVLTMDTTDLYWKTRLTDGAGSVENAGMANTTVQLTT